MTKFARGFALSLLAAMLCGVASAVFAADDAKKIAADSPAKRTESSADADVRDNKEKLDFYRRLPTLLASVDT